MSPIKLSRPSSLVFNGVPPVLLPLVGAGATSVFVRTTGKLQPAGHTRLTKQEHPSYSAGLQAKAVAEERSGYIFRSIKKRKD